MPDTKLNPELFVFPLRVYYEDTDAGGVVYHSNYLNFFERCRTEWLRHLGYEQDELRGSHSVLFVVRNINIDYLKPARFNQQLMITTEVTELGACNIIMHQQVLLGRGSGEVEVLAKGSVSLVSVDSEKFKPKRIPDMIRQSLLSTEVQT
ncbi:tol-pal system-associated acyl-CoA thioesterase [Leucothrix arctica]|uniref:Tol-pal system-associated acyl-CoA thioesterase n=1 Tax=Leucothrix arctica TaxID=1481894 RepID=A0A317CEK6_9GAMM|nr:tol-pal system-associated acyl-CoA thioesterase [Leucothrix arctica]PWQ94552.1 tol-pal system-associated acyl-CoA thioesterase [Leucothrix arctica]